MNASAGAATYVRFERTPALLQPHFYCERSYSGMRASAPPRTPDCGHPCADGLSRDESGQVAVAAPVPVPKCLVASLGVREGGPPGDGAGRYSSRWPSATVATTAAFEVSNAAYYAMPFEANALSIASQPPPVADGSATAGIVWMCPTVGTLDQANQLRPFANIAPFDAASEMSSGMRDTCSDRSHDYHVWTVEEDVALAACLLSGGGMRGVAAGKGRIAWSKVVAQLPLAAGVPARTPQRTRCRWQRILTMVKHRTAPEHIQEVFARARGQPAAPGAVVAGAVPSLAHPASQTRAPDWCSGDDAHPPSHRHPLDTSTSTDARAKKGAGAGRPCKPPVRLVVARPHAPPRATAPVALSGGSVGSDSDEPLFGSSDSDEEIGPASAASDATPHDRVEDGVVPWLARHHDVQLADPVAMMCATVSTDVSCVRCSCCGLCRGNGYVDSEGDICCVRCSHA